MLAKQILKRSPLWLGAMALMLAGVTARAGMFEDEEARKAILDLRAKVEQNAQTGKASTDALRSENEQLRRSILQLNSLIDQLRTDLAQQRGQGEQLARDVSETQRRQKDVNQALDERVRKLEPGKVTVDGVEFVAEIAERKQFEAALALFRKGEFQSAEDAFVEFSRRYPSTGYMPVTLFWLANAQYANKHFKESLINFQSMVKLAPEHVKAPEAMLSVANCQTELKDVKGAYKTLEELRVKYPQSEAAAAAVERLKKTK